MNEKEHTEQQIINNLQAALVRAAAKNWLGVEEAVFDVTILLGHLAKQEN